MADDQLDMKRASYLHEAYAAGCGTSAMQFVREQIERETRAQVEAEIIAYLNKSADEYVEEGAKHADSWGDDCADALRLEAGNIAGGEHRRTT